MKCRWCGEGHDDPDKIPIIHPSCYGPEAIRDMARSVIFCLGGEEEAAGKLSRDHYVTLVVCANLKVGEDI